MQSYIFRQSFTAKVRSGSSVNYTWVIDGLDGVVHEGESYSVVFKKPADYKLKVKWCTVVDHLLI